MSYTAERHPRFTVVPSEEEEKKTLKERQLLQPSHGQPDIGILHF